MKKIYNLVLVLFCILAAGAFTGFSSDAKTVHKSFVVMQGGTRALPFGTAKSSCKIQGKKYISISKNQKTSYSKVSVKADRTTYPILVKGKKAGKGKITLRTGKKTTVFSVKVLSKKSVNKTATKKLKAYKARLKGKDQCLYADFNGDGIKELYHNDSFTYYNYALKKLVTKGAPVISLSKIYTCGKSHMLFAIPSKETRLGEKGSDEERIVYGHFFFFNEAKIFDFLNQDVALSQYVKPEIYVGSRYSNGTSYYFLDDSSYDQDDYWYLPYTEDEMQTFLDQKMPSRKELKLVP